MVQDRLRKSLIKHVEQVFSPFRINHHVKSVDVTMFTTSNKHPRDLMSIRAISRIKLPARAILHEKKITTNKKKS